MWCLAADHPRIRGEHESQYGQRLRQGGSSPHTRGAHYVRGPYGTYQRIIPAYAGSTVSLLSRARVEADHPRIRGEHEFDQVAGIVEAGSSPHTRGARGLPTCFCCGGRIIPAYAGSTTMRNALATAP